MKFPISITVTVLALLLFATLPLCTQAQIGQIAEGDVVKIYAPSFDGKSIVGKVDEVASFGLLVSSGKQRITIPYNTIQYLRVKRGKKNRRSLGMVLGMIPGAIGGALTMKKRCNTNEQVCFLDFTDLENALRVMTGMAIGMTVGSLIGAEFETDRWQRISIGVTYKQSNIQRVRYNLHPSILFSIPLSKRR